MCCDSWRRRGRHSATELGEEGGPTRDGDRSEGQGWCLVVGLVIGPGTSSESQGSPGSLPRVRGPLCQTIQITVQGPGEGQGCCGSRNWGGRRIQTPAGRGRLPGAPRPLGLGDHKFSTGSGYRREWFSGEQMSGQEAGHATVGRAGKGAPGSWPLPFIDDLPGVSPLT